MADYLTDTAAALKALIEAAVPGVPVVNVLEEDDTETLNLPEFVAFLHDSITFDEVEELGDADLIPTDAQDERWTWSLYVKGGGGTSDPAAKAQHINALLAALRSGLFMKRPTPNCDGLQLVAQARVGAHGLGFIYQQDWFHTRSQD